MKIEIKYSRQSIIQVLRNFQFFTISILMTISNKMEEEN